MPSTITQDQLARALALRDLTDPASGPHAMQLVVGAITDALATAWGCPVATHRADPVVTVEENYGLLGYGADAPAREARYTRYLDERRMLRSHTSAIVPGALRAAAAAGDRREIAVACPGLVYRRDVVDRLHVGEPHQLDLWRVRRQPPLTGADLDAMIGTVISAVLPAARYRMIPAEHPYTCDGREVEVLIDDEWVELLECGLAAGHVLAGVGLDPSRWSGLALGIGLDRALMLRKGIGDIRLLRSDDPRVAAQMLTLDRYHEVSSMPPANRDISVAVPEDIDAEGIGDLTREGLPAQILESVEQVITIGETPRAALPPLAIDRIGLQPGQKNVLLRLVLRHPTRTLTADDANRIRDRVYAAIHQGTVSQWASPREE